MHRCPAGSAVATQTRLAIASTLRFRASVVAGASTDARVDLLA